MPAVIEEKPVSKVEESKQKDNIRAQIANNPLAGKRLECPYCGLAYLPEEGCFCVRVVGWDDEPLGHASSGTANIKE